jgi:hypothetical protein
VPELLAQAQEAGLKDIGFYVFQAVTSVYLVLCMAAKEMLQQSADSQLSCWLFTLRVLNDLVSTQALNNSMF